MNLHVLIPSLGVALTVICAATGLVLILQSQTQRRIRSRLRNVVTDAEIVDRVDPMILRDMQLSSIPAVDNFLKRLAWARRLDTILLQGDIPMRVGSFLMLTLSLGCGTMTFVSLSLIHI